jgi:hypothetical protein
MKFAGSILPPNPLLVVSAKWRQAVSGVSPLSLQAGQTVRIEVLPATVSGEARIRIDRHVLSASIARPLPEGATGKAVVKDPGPPILLHLTELTPPSPRESLRIPVLMGKEPLRGGPFPPSAMERWNEALLRQYPPDLRTVSPETIREGILLGRFLSAALAAGGAVGERALASALGLRRKEREEDAGSPDRNAGEEACAGDASRELDAAPRDVSPRDDLPFWFFLPMPGEKSPILFPCHRRREGGEKEAWWGFFLRLPDLGAISVRFRAVDAVWNIAFSVEDERLHQALSAGVGDLGELLRGKGFPLRDVTVGRMPKGQIDAAEAARLSMDLGIPLLERRA